MNKLSQFIKCLLNLIAGYFLVPSVYLGFILTTNSSKGWNVQNTDGLYFIPIGILILIAAISIFAFEIKNLISIKKDRISRYVSFWGYAFGIVIYLVDWFIL